MSSFASCLSVHNELLRRGRADLVQCLAGPGWYRDRWVVRSLALVLCLAGPSWYRDRWGARASAAITSVATILLQPRAAEQACLPAAAHLPTQPAEGSLLCGLHRHCLLTILCNLSRFRLVHAGLGTRTSPRAPTLSGTCRCSGEITIHIGLNCEGLSASWEVLAGASCGGQQRRLAVPFELVD